MSAPSRGIVRSHEGWLQAVESCVRLSERTDACEARAPEVSGWSVAQQLEHLLLADRGILTAIEDALEKPPEGDAAAPQGGPSLVGRFILYTGFIPRGRGKAPDITRPQGMSTEQLASGFGGVCHRVEALGDELARVDDIRATRLHPLLGHFTPARWVRFSRVHHNHHAKIIGDILGAQGVPAPT